ncbi:MAG TPA: beta-propeller domain-containing protein [Polyangiaceae bacterium]|nr:beta-propeller domain-containing protein [Polyangiaceae bacterium]
MRSSFLLACSFVIAGCGASASSSAPPAPSTSSDATRAIAEADIIQVQGGRLYAMSRSGTVSVVDVSHPASLALLAQTHIDGEPFEMYLRGSDLVAMTSVQTYTEIVVLDVGSSGTIAPLKTVAVVGSIADSRFVGDVLYVATYQDSPCQGCSPPPRTIVTSFEAADPAVIDQVDQVTFQSNAPDSYNLPWGSNWTRSILVGDQRLYVGGHADVDPNTYYGQDTTPEGIIDVLDISDPGGRFGKGTRLTVAGAVLSRWQMDERNGVFRVISQKGAGRTGNGVAMPEVATFRIDSTTSFSPLGKTSLQLPMQEGLRTVAFDDDRAYAITYNQTDPLFAIDLSDPAHPKQRGQLSMPGFMFYLQPHGDRVIGLGIDRTDPKGSLNVSLFDVSDMDTPKMLARAPFAAVEFTEDYEILNGELPEDQDRIQKAFRVFDDGLVAVPFASPQGCSDSSSGVQLVRWANDTLANEAFLPLPNHPRRAFENNGEILTVSDSNVRSFASGKETADLVIGTCEQDTPTYSYGGGVNQGGDYYGACSTAAPGAGDRNGGLLALALAGLIAARRRRCSRS